MELGKEEEEREGAKNTHINNNIIIFKHFITNPFSTLNNLICY